MNINNYITKLQNLPDKQKKIIMWVIIAILGIIMVFFWFNSATKRISKIGESIKTIELPQIEKQISSAQTQKDETADWKIYENEQYGFEIKYPSDWTFRQYDSGAAFFSGNKPERNVAGNGIINVGFYKRGVNYCQISFRDYVKVAGPLEIQGYESLNTIDEGTTGLPMYITTWNYSDLNGNKKVSPPIAYFSTSADKCGSMEIFLNDTSYLDVYNQMLSTFKFLK